MGDIAVCDKALELAPQCIRMRRAAQALPGLVVQGVVLRLRAAGEQVVVGGLQRCVQVLQFFTGLGLA
ncbi:hypothetical protein D3C85_1829520 [compost metagenome]